jgi:hypothetical protein
MTDDLTREALAEVLHEAWQNRDLCLVGWQSAMADAVLASGLVVTTAEADRRVEAMRERAAELADGRIHPDDPHCEVCRIREGIRALPITEPAEPQTAHEQPHSRACGIQRHEHGTACHSSCPSCGVAAEHGTNPNAGRQPGRRQ